MEGHEMRDPGGDGTVNHQRLRWGFAVFAVIAFFFLWQEHRAHLLGALPWLFLLACPLMHRFMHRGHHYSGGGHHGDAGTKPAEPRDATQADHEHSGHGCC